MQAEDELAAIGIVIGASWNGARAFTPTSGPGISLMNEFIGLAYYAEIPAVLFDVQRVGPSTGMPTRTQQCDLMSCAYASHGDTRHVLLFPANPEECFYMAVQAFDLAERLQTPVFVLLDLDIGMNDWMVPDLKWDDGYQPDRGKVLTADTAREDRKVQSLPRRRRRRHSLAHACLAWARRGAYFTRGSGHNKYGGYTEDSAEYQEVMDRLLAQVPCGRGMVPKAGCRRRRQGAAAGIVTIGSCDDAVQRSAGDRCLPMRACNWTTCGCTASPSARRWRNSLPATRPIFVVEQNRDAQLKSLLTLETAVEKRKLSSILYYSGLPMSADCIVDGVDSALARGSGGMSGVIKPKVEHPGTATQRLGLTRRATMRAACRRSAPVAATTR